MHKEYTNFYNNLTNVVLVVSPRAGLREKAVLVNAHFDSTLGTTGQPCRPLIQLYLTDPCSLGMCSFGFHEGCRLCQGLRMMLLAWGSSWSWRES